MTALQLAPIVLALLLIVPMLLLGRGRNEPTRQALRSLARERDVAALAPRGVTASARRLRPALPAQPLQRDLGVALGRLEPRGPILRADHEQTVLAIMAPRSGKTTSLVVPAVLDAPGAVLCTSNKADAWACTAALRAEVGAVFTFDPQGVAQAQQTFWWDPLAALTTVDAAERLAATFVADVEDGKDVWGPAAQELLAALFMAAAVSGGTILDAYRWLSDPRSKVPVTALRQAGLDTMADSLEGIVTAPPETSGSVTFTARVATRALRNPEITRWITPQQGLWRFDPADFVASRGTLYLLSQDSGVSAGPLVAALTDAVLHEAVKQAERRGGRLDPPLTAALDEAANIVKIPALPALLSHWGSRGVVPIVVLQSLAQAKATWGDAGSRAMWSASTVKLLGAGIDDAGLARDVSELVGDHDVATTSTTVGGGKRSRSTSVRRDRVLSPAAVRALPRGKALVLPTGGKAAMVQLLPWHAGPRAQEIARAEAAAVQGIAARGAARV